MIPMRGTRNSRMVIRTTTIRLIATMFEQSGNVNDDLTVEELFHAYYACRKHKRNTINALKFEADLETNLMNLYYELIENRYEIGRSVVFYIKYPKPREVIAASFKDRIVHHLIYNRLRPHFHFDYHSYACIPEKGTLRASQAVEKLARSITKNNTVNGYYLKCDIQNFFCSIDKNILFSIIKEKIPQGWILDLTKKVIFNNCLSNAFFKGKGLHVPSYKKLNPDTPDRGLPIGNLSSQFGANILLNMLDRFVRKLRLVKYVRYMDDMILLSDSVEKLVNVYKEINCFLKEKLSLQLNQRKTIIQPIKNGIPFVGHVIKPFRRYTKRSTLNRAIRKANDKTALSTINSYFGIFRNTNSYNIRRLYSEKLLEYGFKVNKQLTKGLT